MGRQLKKNMLVQYKQPITNEQMNKYSLFSYICTLFSCIPHVFYGIADQILNASRIPEYLQCHIISYSMLYKLIQQ
jgi:uncharacterized protein with PQ loop repeat